MNCGLPRYLLSLVAYLMSMNLMASGPGQLLNISATGGDGPVTVEICLNGQGPLSCQTHNITGGYTLAISISSAIPYTCYNRVGLRVLSPAGYVVTSGAAAQYGNYYILSQLCSGQPNTVVVGPAVVTAECSGAHPLCRVFVTNATMNGKLEGVDGCQAGEGVTTGNCICNVDTAKPAGAGQYKVWLSDATVDAIDNIQYVAGVSYFSTTSQLLVVDEGTNFPQTISAVMSLTADKVWSGTLADGTYNASPFASCTQWTRTTGIAATAVSGNTNSSNDNEWNDSSNIGIPSSTCNPNPLNHLYCFEVPE